MSFLLTVIGVLLIFEGVPWFLSPNRIRLTLANLARLPDRLLRLLGLLCMLVGLLLVYLARG